MIPAFRHTVALIGLLMTAATAAGAQGTHFSSFRTERFDVWNDVPAYRARSYIAGAWGVLRAECRAETPTNSGLLDVAGYAMLPAAERFGMGGGIFRLQVVGEDNAFLVQADPERDVRAAFRQVLGNADFATRVGYKCGSVPDFVTAPLPAATLRSARLRTLSTQMARWATPDRNAGIVDDAYMREGRAAQEYRLVLDRDQIKATRLPIQLHVCDYGPATQRTLSGEDDENTYIFWNGPMAPSEAKLRSGLASYRYLDRVIELGKVRVNACPASLAEARALKAGPPLVQSAPPAPTPTPAVQRESPRATTPQVRRSLTVEERRRAVQEAQCRKMERELSAQRTAARAGRITAAALARREAVYAKVCG